MSCIVSMVTYADIGDICYEDTEKVIRYHLFGIGIGTDIVFGISIPERTAGRTETPKYRIPFGIPSSVIFLLTPY